MTSNNEKIYFLNTMPTMIQELDNRYVVFQKQTEEEEGPTTYFYYLDAGVEICKISGSEAFIDMVETTYSSYKYDLISYAKTIGINPKDDADLLYIAKEGLMASGPPLPWRLIQEENGSDYYKNFDTGVITYTNPRREI